MRRRTQEVTDIYDERETSPSTQSCTLIKYFALTAFFSFKMVFTTIKKKKVSKLCKKAQSKKKKITQQLLFESLRNSGSINQSWRISGHRDGLCWSKHGRDLVRMVTFECHVQLYSQTEAVDTTDTERRVFWGLHGEHRRLFISLF